MSRFRRQPHVPFSPVTLLVSPASLSPSGRPLALAREHGSQVSLGAAVSVWAPRGSPICRRSCLPSGEQLEWRRPLFFFLFYAEFKAQPSSNPRSSSVHLPEHPFLGPGAPRPLGCPPAPGLLPAVPGLSILKLPLLSQPLPSQSSELFALAAFSPLCLGGNIPLMPSPSFTRWENNF